MAQKIILSQYKNPVFFTGAGMSKESGVPTYRGAGGIWGSYNPDEVASEPAFQETPEKVLQFHELRRKTVLKCSPNEAHNTLSAWQSAGHNIQIITQNIDGLHQRAGSVHITELHGSLWRLRCPLHGIREDLGEKYARYQCEECNNWLRPDIIWFGDNLNIEVIDQAHDYIQKCDLFVSIGTSGVVWPAAGMPQIARDCGAHCVEINPEQTDVASIYQQHISHTATEALKNFFSEEEE